MIKAFRTDEIGMTGWTRHLSSSLTTDTHSQKDYQSEKTQSYKNIKQTLQDATPELLIRLSRNARQKLDQKKENAMLEQHVR